MNGDIIRPAEIKELYQMALFVVQENKILSECFLKKLSLISSDVSANKANISSLQCVKDPQFITTISRNQGAIGESANWSKKIIIKIVALMISSALLSAGIVSAVG